MPFNIEQALQILEQEVRNYQVPVVDLIAVQTHDPFKVLVATILSARTRDEVTALATPMRTRSPRRGPCVRHASRAPRPPARHQR